MDQKSLLWNKRSHETSLAAKNANNSFTEEPIISSEMKFTEEAIAGWERANREAISLKQEVDKVLREKYACEERLRHMDAECMQKLHVVRQEQDKRIHSAVMKASEEFEKTRIALSERIAILEGENSEFHRALSGKEKVIDELRKYINETEADLKAHILGVESTEKETGSLKYEVCVLQKELNIRNEEAEVSRRTADIAQKKHRESVEKIAKLESECLRLRLLVRRRLPGPAALTKMKNEVEMLGKDDAETGRRRSKPGSMDTPSRRINFLTEKLLRVEEENRSLVHALNTKSRLSMESSKYLFLKEETLSDLDSGSCAESVSISELENFKNEKQLRTPSNRYMGTPEMNLMDDFAEMEKIALNYPAASSDQGNAVVEKDMSTRKTNGLKLESNLRIPVAKILELLEGINVLPQDDAEFIVRVFQWRSDELSALVQQLSQTCSDLLSGEADVEQFVQVVASSLDWIMNHCFSIQDVSSIKDAIKSRLDLDESSGEDSCSAHPSAKSTRLNIQREDVSCIPMISPSNCPNTKQEANNNVMEQEADFGSSFVDLEASDEDVIENLQPERETTRKSIGKNGDQIEKPKIMKQGLEIQLMEINLQQGKAISHMENDLENSYSSFKTHEEEEEETCNDQKTQLQSHSNKEGQANASTKQLQNDLEITTASVKLAECQETLLNLGKQLKALTLPRDAALFDKVISTPADHVITSTPTPRKLVSKRFSLQDKLLEEDKDQTIIPRSTDDTQDGKYSSTANTNAAVASWSKFTNPNGIDNEADTTDGASMAIVPHKKRESRSLLKKLFLWKTKGNRKKNPLKKH